MSFLAHLAPGGGTGRSSGSATVGGWQGEDAMFGQDRDVAGITARLAAAAETAELLELILVVQGRIRPVPGTAGRRWHLRVADEHQVTVWAESVVAATRLAPAPRPPRRLPRASRRAPG